jgi:hypothetical protein
VHRRCDGDQPSGAPSQQGTMCPQRSHRWCEVSQRIVAPQLSHGGSPPFCGTAQAGLSGASVLTAPP